MAEKPRPHYKYAQFRLTRFSYDCPNVLMTPHTSAWSPERQVRVVDLFVENIRRYSIGQPLMNVVDKQKGY